MEQIIADEARRRDLSGAGPCVRKCCFRRWACAPGYGGKPVLQGLEIEVREGEIVAVIGRNGVGKSTLMKSLIGLVPAMGGSIVYRGEAIEALPAHKRGAPSGIGYVPQGRDVFPRLTGRRKTSRSVPRSRAISPTSYGGASSTPFPILAERWGQRARQPWSGGQQQQLAIGARADRRSQPHSAR